MVNLNKEDVIKSALKDAEREMVEAIDKYFKHKACLEAFEIKKKIEEINVIDQEIVVEDEADAVTMMAIREAINEIQNRSIKYRDLTIKHIAYLTKHYLVEPQYKERATPRRVGSLCRKMGYTVRRRTVDPKKGRYEVVL